MKFITKKVSPLSLTLSIGAALGLLTESSSAAVSLTFTQVGADLSVAWNGDLTVSGLSSTGNTFGNIQLNNTAGLDAVIKSQPGDDLYSFSTPTIGLFAGPPSGIVYSSVIGPAVTDRFGFSTSIIGGFIGFQVTVPDGFTSGSVSGGFAATNVNLADLQVQEGTYSWGAADNQRIVVTVVPEPTTIFLGALGLLTGIGRRRR